MNDQPQPAQPVQPPQPMQPVAAAPQEPISSVSEASSPVDTFGKIIFFVILVEIVLMIGLNYYEKAKAQNLDNSIAQANGQLNSPTYKTLNTQVSEILSGQNKLKNVLSSKINWANFYSQLDAVTPNNTRVTAVSLNDNGSYKIDGETSSLTTLAQTMTAWKNGTGTAVSPFTSVVLNSDGYVNDGSTRRVNFSVSGQLNLGGIR